SAVGVLAADVIKDQSRTVMLEVTRGIEKQLDQAFREMEREARTLLQNEGFPSAKQKHERSLAVRYRGQSFELELRKISGNIAGEFHKVHNERYGYAQKNSVVEIVSARLRSVGIVEKLPQKRMRPGRRRIVKAKQLAKAFIGGRNVRVGVYDREELSPGIRLSSPS